MRDRVRKTVVEQAFWLFRIGSLRDEHIERQAIGIDSYIESLGPLSESYSHKDEGQKLCLEARQLLRYYYATPRLVRR